MSDNVAKFFERIDRHPPELSPPGEYSTLYLLRRDINACLGWDAEKWSDSGTTKIIWPGVMGIMAGIDLLAKFYAGTDQGKVGDRFLTFVKRYMCVDDQDSMALYQYRNALIHSYGHWSVDKSKTPPVRYDFQLISRGDFPWLHRLPIGVWEIDLVTLGHRFSTAIAVYSQEIPIAAGLRAKFDAMYPLYGVTCIRPLRLGRVPASDPIPPAGGNGT